MTVQHFSSVFTEKQLNKNELSFDNSHIFSHLLCLLF